MTDREQLDARWQARRDAEAAGDPPPPDEMDLDAGMEGSSDPRWAAEEAFYDALAEEGQATPLTEGDRACIEAALLADTDAAAPSDAQTPGTEAANDAAAETSTGRGGGLRWLAAAVAVAAAIAIVWIGWPSEQIAAITRGSWVAQADGTAHGSGDALPQAIWLVAGPDACGTVDGATLCAEEGTVVRVVVEGGGRPRVEVERGAVTVREGAWTVVTPEGEQTLRAGESLRVTPAALADATRAIVPEPPTALPTPQGPAGDEGASAPSDEDAPVGDEGTPHEPGGDEDPAGSPPDASDGAPKKTRPTPAQDAATMLAKARGSRGAGDGGKASREFAALIKAHPDSAEAAVARVALGQLRLSSGRHRAALGLFSGYLRRGGPLAEEALWGKIQALDGLGQDAALREAVDALERRFPRSVYLSRAKERVSP